MILDVHTHIFPPRMIEDRARLATTEPGFAAIYATPRARMASADDLLASMDAAEVDVAVACGFWWVDVEHAREHRAYLLESAKRSHGRLVPFVPFAAGEQIAVIREAARAGALGVGEVRIGEPDARLLHAVTAEGLAVLAHCSEEVGHKYRGKVGGFTPGALWRFVAAEPSARVIAAHWGGGFPFYALMPEVHALLREARMVFDSAASPLLYEPSVFTAVCGLAGGDLVLWGSDFPLRDQASDRAAVTAAIVDDAQRDAVLGGNAARFLHLE